MNKLIMSTTPISVQQCVCVNCADDAYETNIILDCGYGLCPECVVYILADDVDGLSYYNKCPCGIQHRISYRQCR